MNPGRTAAWTLLMLFAFPVGSVQAQVADLEPGPSVASSTLAGHIRNRVQAAADLPDRLLIRGERVSTSASLSEFYEGRAHSPAWVSESGVNASARNLLYVLQAASDDGLRPEDYHVPQLIQHVQELDAQHGGRIEAGRLVDIELLLTDGFLLYGTHLLAGRVDATTLEPNWRAQRRERDMVALLNAAVHGSDPGAVLLELRPPQPEYAQLMSALATYRALERAGDWPRVPDGERLTPDDRDVRVGALRARLAVDPTLTAAVSPVPSDDPTLYDGALAQAVRAFQGLNGLDADGIVGAATLAALNASPSDRVRQLEANLERWRWLPQDLGSRHVLVNAADFSLVGVQRGEVEVRMRAIVGRRYRQTPVFSDRITSIVFRPYWHVPQSLAVQDQLPLQKKDVTYFRRLGFRLFDGWGADAREVDPASIDWSTVTARSFRYRLRQDPGPQNFLGAAKFMFPNSFNVYLHDTPGKDLFRKQMRDFSSGCIRVEDPRGLALWLLRGQPGWSPERIDRAMKADAEEAAYLSSPVPVHLLYWTAFIDPEGTLQFRADIYDRDTRLIAALR